VQCARCVGHGADALRLARFLRHAKHLPCEIRATSIVVSLDDARKEKKERPLKRPLVVHLVHTAEAWQGLLDRGEVKNRAELARRFQVSGMRVTTILALNKLHPDIRAAVLALPPGTPERLLTERKLRALTSAPPKAQLQALAWFLKRKATG